MKLPSSNGYVKHKAIICLDLGLIPMVSIMQIFQTSPHYNKTSKIKKILYISSSLDKGYLTCICNDPPKGRYTTILQHITPGTISTFMCQCDP